MEAYGRTADNNCHGNKSGPNKLKFKLLKCLQYERTIDYPKTEYRIRKFATHTGRKQMTVEINVER